jgi:NAD(P)-dependent dehydrogenase (short-subunit alcohol dehydrogenase family)
MLPAKSFLDNGAFVISTTRSQDAAARVKVRSILVLMLMPKEELGNPKNLHVIVGDMSDEPGAKAIAAEIAATYTNLDVVVSCFGSWWAGPYPLHACAHNAGGPTTQQSLATFQSVLGGKLVPHFLAAANLYRLLSETGAFIIINGAAAEQCYSPESGLTTV